MKRDGNMTTTNSSPLTRKKAINRNFKKLDKIENFKENWNGYSATTFSQNFIFLIKEEIKKFQVRVNWHFSFNFLSF